MSDETKEVDAHSGVETTGHSWDGIRELNNPLPRWWLYIFYATVIWAVGYMIFMPTIPGVPGLRNHSDRALVEESMDRLAGQRADRSTVLLDASLEEIETDRSLQQFAMAMGESLFGDNCATCHGAGGRGAVGYPSLADDVWLWDGTLDGIEYTVRFGIRDEDNPDTRFSAMPAFGRAGILDSKEIDDLTQYTLNLSGQDADMEAVSRAAPLFEQQCASCHGSNGMGDRSVGAPNLTDSVWLYGSSEDAIQSTIYNARNSQMPAWDGRLNDAAIKAVSVYVHSLSGGE